MKKIQCQLKLSVIQPPKGGADGGRDDHRHAVEREGLAALLDGEGVGEDGLLAGGEAAAAEALQHAREDQQGQRLRETAQHGADREHGHAGHVEALAADAVGEPAGDGQHDGARHQVAGEHPGGFLLGGAERAGHVRQGDVGDGGVEHLHERGQRDGDGDGPWVVVRLPVQFVEDEAAAIRPHRWIMPCAGDTHRLILRAGRQSPKSRVRAPRLTPRCAGAWGLLAGADRLPSVSNPLRTPPNSRFP